MYVSMCLFIYICVYIYVCTYVSMMYMVFAGTFGRSGKPDVGHVDGDVTDAGAIGDWW